MHRTVRGVTYVSVWVVLWGTASSLADFVLLQRGAYETGDTGQAVTSEGEVTLSDKELKLMELFSRNVDKVLARADILEEVWGMDAFPTDRTVDNFIMRLRRLFEADPEAPTHLLTLRGRGYLFKP